MNRSNYSWNAANPNIQPETKTLKVKVSGEVKVQGHIVGLTSYRLASISFPSELHFLDISKVA